MSPDGWFALGFALLAIVGWMEAIWLAGVVREMDAIADGLRAELKRLGHGR